MKLLIVKEINNRNYFLVEDTQTGKKEELIFEFLSDEKPKKDDIICLDEQLLDKNSEYFAQPFCYKFLGEENDIIKSYIDKNATEYLVIIKENKRLLFKRIYG